MIAINEAIIECINNLLTQHHKIALDLSNFTEIDLVELESYLTEKIEIPLEVIVVIARFFGLNLEEFLTKAKIVKSGNSVDAIEILNFKKQFMNKFNKNNS